MSSLESGLNIPEQKKTLEGREAISVGAAIATQIALMHAMIPDNFADYMDMSDGQHVGIEDKLFERWSAKYASAFREFCDEYAHDMTFIAHVESQDLQPDEFLLIKNEMIQKGGPFFNNETETTEFIKEYIH